jgi:hypothetical protein
MSTDLLRVHPKNMSSKISGRVLFFALRLRHSDLHESVRAPGPRAFDDFAAAEHVDCSSHPRQRSCSHPFLPAIRFGAGDWRAGCAV